MRISLRRLFGIPPLRPAAQTPYALGVFALNWITFVLLLAFIALHLGVRLWFPHTISAHGITLHARVPLPSNAPAVLAEAATLADRSELAEPGRRFDVYLSDTPLLGRLFVMRSSSFAVYMPLTDNVFIANADLQSNIAHNGQPQNNTRRLAAVIAHEMTHSLIFEKVGVLQTLRTSTWVLEGYCDWIAGEGSYPHHEGLQRLLSGRDDTTSSYRYFVGRHLVGYLIEQRKMSFREIVGAAREDVALYSHALDGLRQHLAPPGGARKGQPPRPTE